MQKKVRQRLICYTFNAIFHMERMISEAASLAIHKTWNQFL